MNGIWIRSGDGRRLVLSTDLMLGGAGSDDWSLYAAHGTVQEDEYILLATFDDEAHARRQLDDIQKWMSEGTSMTTYEYEDIKHHVPRVYDLRELKVKEEAR